MMLLLLTAACGCANRLTPVGSEPVASAPGTATKLPVISEADDAQAVFEKSITAFGGPDKFSRWNVGRVSYKATGSAFAPFEGTFMEDTFELPGHFKRTARVKADAKELSYVFVLNHRNGWARYGDGRLRTMTDNPSTDRERHLFTVFFDLTQVQAASPNLAVLSRETDKVIVRQTIDKENYVDYFFDKARGLLVKLAKPHPLKAGSNVETVLDDYKTFDGGAVPTRITSRVDGKLLVEITILDLQFVKTWDEATVFGKP